MIYIYYLRNIQKKYWVVLFLISTSISQSADFYVCDCENNSDVDCILGNDGSDGSLANPFQSITKANQTFNTISAGDSIQFCSGGAWMTSLNLRWVNQSCRHDNICAISNYTPPWASGDEARPILNFQNGVNGINLSDSSNAEHEEGYLIENLDLRGSDDGNGILIANDVDDVILSNLLISHFNIGVHIGGSQNCTPSDNECDGKNERITLKDSTIQHNSSQGWLGGSNGVKILNNYFSDNGTQAIFDHNIYISGSSHEITHGILVSGNQLYRNTLNSEGACSSVSLVVHGEHDNLVIKNNKIWEDEGLALQNCWGIAVDGGYTEAESFTNIFIQSNSIINVGRVGIGIGSCESCFVENNTISNNQDFSIRAILAPDRALAKGDLPMDELTVRNNSIYINNSFGGTGVTVGSMGENHIIVSNAIYYNGNSNSFNCFDTDLPDSSYLDIDNNLCYHPNAFSAQWANGIGDLETWQLSSGFDADSETLAPNFSNPAMNQLNPLDGHANTVNSGHLNRSSTFDITGASRDGSPDIGAYEWVAGDVIFINGFEQNACSQETLFEENFNIPNKLNWPNTWQESGTSIELAEVINNEGRLIPLASNSPYSLARIYHPLSNATDVEATFSFVFENASSQGIGLYVRSNGGHLNNTDPSGQGYVVFIERFMGNQSRLGLWYEHNGIETSFIREPEISPGVFYDFQDNVKYNVKFQVFQEDISTTRLRAKIWQDGSIEPVSWGVSVTDDYAPLQNISGHIAIDSYNTQSNGTITDAIRIDDILIKTICESFAQLVRRVKND